MNDDEHEINSIESDEERITIIPHISRDNCISPLPNLENNFVESIVDEIGTTKIIEKNKNFNQEKQKYISEIEINGRIMKFNTAPLKLKRDDGIFKIIELILILVALVLSSMVVGVSGERGFAMLVCFFAIMLIFGIVLAKVFTLDQIMDAKLWGLIKTIQNGNIFQHLHR
uniref:Uncharacterized protein n=1 Tax=Panagrolaimus sp. JU765 TaxID=591449 RepID=A0AC34QEA4_9BILA